MRIRLILVLNSQFESRLLSYMCEKDIEAVLCSSHDCFFLYLNEKDAAGNRIWDFIESIHQFTIEDRFLAYQEHDKTRRGYLERACGLWTIKKYLGAHESTSNRKVIRRVTVVKDNCQDFESIHLSVSNEIKYLCNLKSTMSWNFIRPSSGKKKKAKTTQPFSISIRGDCGKVSKQDMQDLLGIQSMSLSTNDKNTSQSIVFLQQNQKRRKPEELYRMNEPLFLDVPEGARILALLASSQRKARNMLRIPRSVTDESASDEDTYGFMMKQEEIDVSKRWTRFGSSNMVFVDESSVPATAISTTSYLFGVASNALELQRGGLKVEGLTLLPPNPLFLTLSFLSFGLGIGEPISWMAKEDEGESRMERNVNNAYTWLVQRSKVVKDESHGHESIVLTAKLDDNYNEVPVIWKKDAIKDKLTEAALFNESSLGMGEKLVCYPEKIQEVLNVFDGIDNENLSLWDTINEESLTEKNLLKWNNERKTTVKVPRDYHIPVTDVIQDKNAVVEKPTKNDRKNSSKPKNGVVQHSIRQFNKKIRKQSDRWFATTLNNGETMSAFPVTNILALLFQMFGDHESVINNLTNGSKQEHKDRFKISLDANNWDIIRYTMPDDDDDDDSSSSSGKVFYRACFVNDCIPLNPVHGRNKNRLPKWIKKNHRRPTTIADAKDCVPPNIVDDTKECPSMHVMPGIHGIVFESIEDAIKMEAAFWLEQQFCYVTKVSTIHWYLHTVEQMIHILLQNHEKTTTSTATDNISIEYSEYRYSTVYICTAYMNSNLIYYITVVLC